MVVGDNRVVKRAIPKEMDKLICDFRVELQKKHKKPVSKRWAALQLTMEFNKRK